MPGRVETALGVLLLMAGILPGLAQQAARPEGSAGTAALVETRKDAEKKPRMVSADDGLSIIAAALDSKVRRYSGADCSHLVHAIYDRAGFPYSYASSNDLYAGVEGFRRVSHPQPGDVIVWPGHAGVVVRPSRHIFFSFKTAGPGTDDYKAPYWRGRGEPRFYRYLQNSRCAGCAVVSKSAHRSH
jgi:cell wall-associated NlpC family hydrolase